VRLAPSSPPPPKTFEYVPELAATSSEEKAEPILQAVPLLSPVILAEPAIEMKLAVEEAMAAVESEPEFLPVVVIVPPVVIAQAAPTPKAELAQTLTPPKVDEAPVGMTVSKSGVIIVYDTPKEEDEVEEVVEVIEEEIVEVVELKEEPWELVASNPSPSAERAPSPELGSEPELSFDDAEESDAYFDDDFEASDEEKPPVEPVEKTIMPRTQAPADTVIMARTQPAIKTNNQYGRRDRHDQAPVAASTSSKQAGFGATADESIESEEQDEMMFSNDGESASFELDF
jgi:hypothetical protein